MDPLVERAVVPFYLSMMQCNAVWDDPDVVNGTALLPELVRVGSGLDVDDVRRLLRDPGWRPMVMGAWFALGFDAADVGTDLTAAMRRCAGSLTAPPLVTACVLVLGADAVPALEHYAASAFAVEDGSDRFALAAVAHLRCATPADAGPATWPAMLAFGARLRGSLRDAREAGGAG